MYLYFRSLQIAISSEILEIKENDVYQIQIGAADRLLKKIGDILKSHVKHNASHVISKDEIIALQDQIPLFNSMQEQLGKLPQNREDLEEHLKIINEIETKLEKITGNIESSSSKINNLQMDTITQSSNFLYFSS